MMLHKPAQALSTDMTCTQCKSRFITSMKKHRCSQCNAVVCGKCSESRLNTNNKVLCRQRLCAGCISTTAPSLISPFPPSKLHALNAQDISQAHTLWSADSDTDCESEINRSHDWKTPSKATVIKKSVLHNSSTTSTLIVPSNKIHYSMYLPLLIMTVVALLLSSIYLNLPNLLLVPRPDSVVLSELSVDMVDPHNRRTYDVLLKAHMANFRKDLNKALEAQVHDRQYNRVQETRNSQVGFFKRIRNIAHAIDIFFKRLFHRLTHIGRHGSPVHIQIQAKQR